MKRIISSFLITMTLCIGMTLEPTKKEVSAYDTFEKNFTNVAWYSSQAPDTWINESWYKNLKKQEDIDSALLFVVELYYVIVDYPQNKLILEKTIDLLVNKKGADPTKYAALAAIYILGYADKHSIISSLVKSIDIILASKKLQGGEMLKEALDTLRTLNNQKKSIYKSKMNQLKKIINKLVTLPKTNICFDSVFEDGALDMAFKMLDEYYAADDSKMYQYMKETITSMIKNHDSTFKSLTILISNLFKVASKTSALSRKKNKLTKSHSASVDELSDLSKQYSNKEIDEKTKKQSKTSKEINDLKRKIKRQTEKLSFLKNVTITAIDKKDTLDDLVYEDEFIPQNILSYTLFSIKTYKFQLHDVIDIVKKIIEKTTDINKFNPLESLLFFHFGMVETIEGDVFFKQIFNELLKKENIDVSNTLFYGLRIPGKIGYHIVKTLVEKGAKIEGFKHSTVVNRLVPRVPLNAAISTLDKLTKKNKTKDYQYSLNIISFLIEKGANPYAGDAFGAAQMLPKELAQKVTNILKKTKHTQSAKQKKEKLEKERARGMLKSSQLATALTTLKQKLLSLAKMLSQSSL